MKGHLQAIKILADFFDWLENPKHPMESFKPLCCICNLQIEEGEIDFLHLELEPCHKRCILKSPLVETCPHE